MLLVSLSSNAVQIFGGGVLLLVDELLKARSANNARSMVHLVLHCAGDALDEYGYFHAVVTTLDQVPVLQEFTASGRPIFWPTLPCATLQEAISLFMDKENQLPPLAVRQLISDCAGHFRTLELLAEVYSTVQNDPAMLTYTHLKKMLFKHPLLRSAGGWSRLTPKEGLAAIQAALRGDSVYGTDQIAGFTVPFRVLVAKGIFLNTFDESEKTVPALHPLALLLWADEHLNHPLAGHVARIISSMLDHEPTDFQDHVFEKFHAHFEALRRALFHGEETDIMNSYPSTTFSHSKSQAIFTYHQCRIENKDTTVKTTANMGALLKDAILRPAENNPGFDLLLLEGEKEKFALCIECKYFKPGAATKITANEILEKYDLAIEQLEPHFKELGLAGQEKVFLVVAAFRDIMGVDLEKKVEKLEEKKASRIIVLGRKELERLYTQTLASRPQFYAECML
jgi:ribosomal protein L15